MQSPTIRSQPTSSPVAMRICSFASICQVSCSAPRRGPCRRSIPTVGRAREQGRFWNRAAATSVRRGQSAGGMLSRRITRIRPAPHEGCSRRSVNVAGTTGGARGGSSCRSRIRQRNALAAKLTKPAEQPPHRGTRQAVDSAIYSAWHPCSQSRKAASTNRYRNGARCSGDGSESVYQVRNLHPTVPAAEARSNSVSRT